MDRIKTDIVGGLPFDLPDLEFMQDSAESLFNALALIISKHPYAILSGCHTNNGGVSEGYIILNGELLKHGGTPLPIKQGQAIWWIKTETDDRTTVKNRTGHGCKTLETETCRPLSLFSPGWCSDHEAGQGAA